MTLKLLLTIIMLVIKKCYETLIHLKNVLNLKTYIKMSITVYGMRKISEKAMSLKMFRDWNSTREIRRRAPHHELWPIS